MAAHRPTPVSLNEYPATVTVRRAPSNTPRTPARDWTLVFLGGGTTRIFPQEIGPILRHPYLVLFYIAMTVANLAMAAPLLAVTGAEPLLNLRLPLVCLGMIAGLLVLLATIRSIAWLQRRHTTARIHVSLPILTSILAGQITLCAAQWLLLDTPFPPLWWFVASVITFQVMGEAFLGFLLRHADRILQEVRAHQPAPSTPETTAAPAELLAGNQRFRADAILRLSAQGNYVRVITDTTEALVPGPLSDLVATLPEGLGALVHRSDWIATRAVAATTREGRNTALLLTDGSAVRVASSREALIRDWLAQFSPEPARRRKSLR